MKNFNTAFALLITMSVGNQLSADELTGFEHKPIRIVYAQRNLPPEVFMNQALLYGLKETQLSGVAAQNAGSEKIKSFAKSVLDYHTEANKELLAIARSKKFSLPASKPEEGQRPDGRVDSAPTTLQDTSRNQNQGEAGNSGQPKGVMLEGFSMLRDADIQKSVIKLKDLKGKEFDEAYLSTGVQDYQNLVALFEAGSKSSDVSVKKFAKKHLPRFKSRLKELTAIASEK